MKKKILTFLLFPALCFSAPSPVLTLTETNGVSITGKIISHSTQTGSTKIQTEKSISRRPISAFTPESQEKISHWLADKNFRLKSKLTASFRATHAGSFSNIVGTITDSRTKTTREDTIGTKELSFCSYKINLTNKASTPFENLTLDYRIFYTQRWSKDFTGKYQLAGSTNCNFLSAGGTLEFKTNPFLSAIYYKSAPRIRWTGKPRSFSSSIEGIWLCVRKKDVTGRWIEQEIKYGEVPSPHNRNDYQKLYN